MGTLALSGVVIYTCNLILAVCDGYGNYRLYCALNFPVNSYLIIGGQVIKQIKRKNRVNRYLR